MREGSSSPSLSLVSMSILVVTMSWLVWRLQPSKKGVHYGATRVPLLLPWSGADMGWSAAPTPQLEY